MPREIFSFAVTAWSTVSVSTQHAFNVSVLLITGCLIRFTRTQYGLFTATFAEIGLIKTVQSLLMYTSSYNLPGVLRNWVSDQITLNPLNAKIVAANLSCSAKVVFVKEKRWLCQGIEAPCNALVSVLRLYSKSYTF